MIFHKYRMIWTGIPKNASTTIHAVLRNPTDHQHDHFPLVDDYRRNDSELMDLYMNVAIVRNPYDRFVSATWQSRRDDWELRQDWDINQVFHQEYFQTPQENGGVINEVYIPQHKFICFGKKILADKLLRYETLEKDWKEFITEYNSTADFKLPERLPVHNNSGNRKPWKEEIKALSQENLDLINKIYRLDFELFEYDIIDKVPK